MQRLLGRWGCEEAEAGPPSRDPYPGPFPAGLPPGTPLFTSPPGCPKPPSPTHGQPGSPQGRDERGGARCGEPALPKVVSVGLLLLPGLPEPSLSSLAAWLPEPSPYFLVDWFALGRLWGSSCSCCASSSFRFSVSAALRQ